MCYITDNISALLEVWLQVTFQRLDKINHLALAHLSDKMTSQSSLIKYDGKFYRSIISAWYEQNQRCPLLSYRAISSGNNQQLLKWNVSNLSTVPAAIQFIKVRNKQRRAHVQWCSEGKWLPGISTASRMWLTDDFGLVFLKIQGKLSNLNQSWNILCNTTFFCPAVSLLGNLEWWGVHLSRK